MNCNLCNNYKKRAERRGTKNPFVCSDCHHYTTAHKNDEEPHNKNCTWKLCIAATQCPNVNFDENTNELILLPDTPDIPNVLDVNIDDGDYNTSKGEINETEKLQEGKDKSSATTDTFLKQKKENQPQ